MQNKQLISIITPIYNEADNLIELSKQLTKVFDNNLSYDFEVLLVENGSTDQSFEISQQISIQDKRFKIIKLSRNFGCDGGVTAGLSYATGDAAVIMASDLQDPPELINQFIKKWQAGYENIYQIVSKRTGSSFIRKINSQLFYYIVNLMTGGVIPKNVSDFRLIDKKVYTAINKMHERNRFIRGLFAWSGFKSVGIPFARSERFKGESKANTLRVLSLALRGIFAYSYIPLKVITWAGIILSFFAFILLTTTFIKYFFYDLPFAGYGSIMSVVLLMFGFLFIFLGIIGKYIGLIYEEVKKRPNYIVSEVYPNNKDLKVIHQLDEEGGTQ
ncbi:glycosyltransferase family 2 protein [Candidatus Pseudothioglobus sp. Uisw_086]|uniref:glycosyltransferase family 2 protein n=1 Tax=Candidatus Pseudothioglobus sp. Uisw_086 TaxID=3230998 RepID=UPI003A8C2B92